jgi:hypothetical protein
LNDFLNIQRDVHAVSFGLWSLDVREPPRWCSKQQAVFVIAQG